MSLALFRMFRKSRFAKLDGWATWLKDSQLPELMLAHVDQVMVYKEGLHAALCDSYTQWWNVSTHLTTEKTKAQKSLRWTRSSSASVYFSAWSLKSVVLSYNPTRNLIHNAQCLIIPWVSSHGSQLWGGNQASASDKQPSKWLRGAKISEGRLSGFSN